MFITFEGGEGGGKSTHARTLAAKLQAEGHDVVVTREPGGSPGGEAVRELLVSGDPAAWSAEAEALLNYAARDNHLRTTIRPALKRGATVICDRFMDSTRAYQGYAGGCDLSFIDTLERTIVGSTRPNLTLILDLDPRVGLERAKRRGNDKENRFEQKGLAFHEALRHGFMVIAQSDPGRCKVIDCNRPIDEVTVHIERYVRSRL